MRGRKNDYVQVSGRAAEAEGDVESCAPQGLCSHTVNGSGTALTFEPQHTSKVKALSKYCFRNDNPPRQSQVLTWQASGEA